MTPTPAQIEAAAKAIARAEVGLASNDRRLVHEELAKAALTAAAEVGEPDAQAIERWEEEDKKDEVETRKLKNHTIERCAQVVEHIEANATSEFTFKEIAAAIRSLKG